MGLGSPLPGHKAKAARALAGNIRWLVDTFGVERVGFLTLTFADGLTDREESERRFNSLMNQIRRRYQCGVIVLERREDGTIHYHLLAVLGGDIRTGLDFEAVKRRDYRSAPARLRMEWTWWRENGPKFGFGRHELLPIRTTGEQVGHYVFKYVKKDWQQRRWKDSGFRTLRYFGRWSRDGRPCGPPWSLRHGTMTPKARAWRAAMDQIRARMDELGLEWTHGRLKDLHGRYWAFKQTLALRWWQIAPAGDEPMRAKISEHNEEVARTHGASSRNQIANAKPQHFFPAADWTDDDLRRARRENRRDCETYRLLRQSAHE